jgi:hypothetical protein
MANKSTSEMNKKIAKEMTTNFTDFDISKLSFTNLEENDRSKGQKIAYPRYEHPQLGNDQPLFIQFPWIHLSSYGVPKISEFIKDDYQRLFLKIPLDQSVPEIKIFSDLLKSLDDKLGSQEYKEKLFGTKASKYEYQPIFRMPQEEDEDEKAKNKKKDYGPRQPYMKLKIDATYPDNKIISIVFTSIMVNNKRTRTKVNNILTIDDFAANITWMSRIHPIARPIKLWAHNASKKDPAYGLSFKLVKIEVEPSQNNLSKVKDYQEIDGFLDSDSDDEVKATLCDEVKIPEKQLEKKPTLVESDSEADNLETKQDDSDDSDESDDFDESNDLDNIKKNSDSELETQTIKTLKKTAPKNKSKK